MVGEVGEGELKAMMDLQTKKDIQLKSRSGERCCVRIEVQEDR